MGKASIQGTTERCVGRQEQKQENGHRSSGDHFHADLHYVLHLLCLDMHTKSTLHTSFQRESFLRHAHRPLTFCSTDTATRLTLLISFLPLSLRIPGLPKHLRASTATTPNPRSSFPNVHFFRTTTAATGKTKRRIHSTVSNAVLVLESMLGGDLRFGRSRKHAINTVYTRKTAPSTNSCCNGTEPLAKPLIVGTVLYCTQTRYESGIYLSRQQAKATVDMNINHCTRCTLFSPVDFVHEQYMQ